jgi:glycosyltransferase domain-containing protein
VTFVIPSVHRRTNHLRSCLEHLRDCGVGAQILISDHSQEPDRHKIVGLVSEIGPPQAKVIHHPPSMHFLERLSDCAEQATTPYVVVHADDDFMMPNALESCAAFLDAHEDFAACQGRTFFFRLHPSRRSAPSSHRSLSRKEPGVPQRVAEHCANFTPTLYALTRREAFIRANRGALGFTQNVIFWQYLSSCLLLREGKLRTLDPLYYLRLDNPGGWRATLVRDSDPTHWPYLIVAPSFSEELERFKSGLRFCLEELPHTERAAAVDGACLGLIRRVFTGALVYDQAERELEARFAVEQSYEQEVLAYCSALAARALDESVAGSASLQT